MIWFISQYIDRNAQTTLKDMAEIKSIINDELWYPEYDLTFV